jgi:hypothetical protein
MSESFFENGGFEGDWEQGGELAWNEYDWQRYLKRTEVDQIKFLTLYLKYRHLPDGLDCAAHHMGWDFEDWAPAQPAQPDPFDTPEFGQPAQPTPPEDKDPYTVHRHPVFTVTHALYLHLQKAWEIFLSRNISCLTPKHLSRFSGSLHAGELNAVMAINALDMGDFHLAICHLKHALAAINHTMGLLKRLQGKRKVELDAFRAEVQGCAFDLREVWLRLLRECREEARLDADPDIEGDPL